MLTAWRCFVLGLCLLGATPSWARIALVLNGQQEIFQQFADTLSPRLTAQGFTVSQHDVNQWSTTPAAGSLQKNDLLIAIGHDAAARLANVGPQTAVLCVLLSRQQYQSVKPRLLDASRVLSAIYQDPPASRQLHLAALLLPAAQRVGFLYQDDDPAALTELQQLIQQRNGQLQARLVPGNSDLPAALVEVIERSDFLLASADAALYNRYTIKTILTAAYRQEKVLIGSSPAFVKAGSLATTFSTVQHIARQVDEWLAVHPPGEPIRLPAADYARYFDVSVNTDVARSLNIPLPSREELMQALSAQTQPAPKVSLLPQRGIGGGR